MTGVTKTLWEFGQETGEVGPHMFTVLKIILSMEPKSDLKILKVLVMILQWMDFGFLVETLQMETLKQRLSLVDTGALGKQKSRLLIIITLVEPRWDMKIPLVAVGMTLLSMVLMFRQPNIKFSTVWNCPMTILNKPVLLMKRLFLILISLTVTHLLKSRT